jgi:hypothetical protein
VTALVSNPISSRMSSFHFGPYHMDSTDIDCVVNITVLWGVLPCKLVDRYSTNLQEQFVISFREEECNFLRPAVPVYQVCVFFSLSSGNSHITC